MYSNAKLINSTSQVLHKTSCEFNSILGCHGMCMPWTAWVIVYTMYFTILLSSGSIIKPFVDKTLNDVFILLIFPLVWSIYCRQDIVKKTTKLQEKLETVMTNKKSILKEKEAAESVNRTKVWSMEIEPEKMFLNPALLFYILG